MVHQERFEDACGEYDRVLRLLTTILECFMQEARFWGTTFSTC